MSPSSALVRLLAWPARGLTLGLLVERVDQPSRSRHKSVYSRQSSSDTNRRASSPLFFDRPGEGRCPFFLPSKRAWSAGEAPGRWRDALDGLASPPRAHGKSCYQDPPLRGRAPPLTEGAAPPRRSTSAMRIVGA